ncbi:hypothetical protein BASA50_010396 [Batrachochytrium salamandrivorans]|uniref:Uncharacterized protein n=1 Tax=Batrachochytrium salamandrivorans TaxID=1357716 RepID=A0ABQ8EZ35_9FUNG|nr:hypothetical protein BASA50_010396 [Batrachochytrium salamandrivorans]
MSTQALVLTKGDRALSMLLEAPSQAFSHINNRPSRAKLELGLALSKESALTSSGTVASQLGGEKGVAIEKIMESIYNFYRFISNAKSRYSRLSKDLKMSDNRHLEGLEMHVKAVETYKCGLSGQFNEIKDMVEDHRKNSDHKSLSKALLSSLGFKGRSEVRTKPAKD